MTITLVSPHPSSLPGRSAQTNGAQVSRRRPSPAVPASAPCCSLKARPASHPAPSPSWEDLLGQR